MLISVNKDDQNLAGAITYWSLRGDVDGEALNGALERAGLGAHALKFPSPRKALRRAMQECTDTDTYLRTHAGAVLLPQPPRQTLSGYTALPTMYRLGIQKGIGGRVVALSRRANDPRHRRKEHKKVEFSMSG